MRITSGALILFYGGTSPRSCKWQPTGPTPGASRQVFATTPISTTSRSRTTTTVAPRQQVCKPAGQLNVSLQGSPIESKQVS